MDDVTRALERAELAFCATTSAGGFALTIGERTRAAVLAFLKAMPAMTRHKLSTGDGGYAYSPDGWNLHALAAAIEEQQP